jgi:hypothetical protein
VNIFQLGRVTAVATTVGLVVAASSGVASAMDKPSSPRGRVSSGNDHRGGASHSLSGAQDHQHLDYAAGVHATTAVKTQAAAEALRRGVFPDTTDAGFTAASPRDVEQAFRGMRHDHETMAVIAAQMTAGRPHDVQILVPLPGEHNGQVHYRSAMDNRSFSGLELDGYDNSYAALTPAQQQSLPPAERARYKTGPQYHLFYKITDISALPLDSPVSPVGAQVDRSLPAYIQKWITYKPNTFKGKVLNYLYRGAGRGKEEFTVDDLIKADVIEAGKRQAAASTLIKMERAGYFKVAQRGRGGHVASVATMYKLLNDGELNTVSTASRIDTFLRKSAHTVQGKILQHLWDRPGQSFSETDLIAAELLRPGTVGNADLTDLSADGLLVTTKGNSVTRGPKPNLYQIPPGS